MIDKYLNDLDAFLSASPAVVEIDILRRDFRDTGLEKIALYRYRLKLQDGSTIDITERIVEEREKIEITKYRYHWQTRSGKLIMRWDNAPHHPKIDSFPDHLHVDFDDHVERFNKMNALDMLIWIIDMLKSND